MFRFLIFFLFLFSISFAQNQDYRKKTGAQQVEIYGKISGLVKDSDTKDVLPYASVSLLEASDLKIIEGTITNEKGYFVFDDLSSGQYVVEVSYNGYISNAIECEITPKKLHKNLKKIFLEIDTYILQDIQLSTEAPVYENKIEKIVYNVANDISQSANNGIDVLRNAPLVSVDIDDKVSLRGSENVKFLLNGKTSSFLNKDNISDVLQTIPVEQIKAIEVITSPGAKYDAEGDAGIINIVTNQKNIEGFNASINTSTGTRVNRSSFNLNAGKNRFGISASGGARYGWPRDGNTSVLNTTFDNAGNILTNQVKNGSFVGNWVGFRGSIDLYYDINAYNSITSNVHIGGHNRSNKGEEDVLESAFEATGLQYAVSDTSSNNDTEYEYTVNYIKTFPEQEGREIVFSVQYGRHVHDDNQDFTQTDPELEVNNEMIGKGHELTGQIDYVHPFGNDNKFEIGIKSIDRRTNNDYVTDVLNISDASNWLSSDSLSNIFQYNQQVSAFYMSLNFNLFNDISFLFGTRYEYTGIKGAYVAYYQEFDHLLLEQVPGLSKNIITRSYNTIVPNVTIAKKLNMFQTLKLSYTNRIQRPDIHKVNTNIEISDLRNISRGNPTLDPSQSHQLELGYTSFKPGLMTSFFAYYKGRYNVVESFTFMREIEGFSIFETNYENIGNSHSFGFNFFGSTTIKKILTLRGGLDIYTYNMSTSVNNVDLFRKSLNYKYNVSANLTLGKGYKLESRAFFRSPSQTIQGERPSFSMMSFGVKKEFSNKRGSIGIGMIEPFSKYKSFDTSISGVNADGSTFENVSDYEILFRSFNLNFKYKFGKIDFNPIKKKAILENNDTMDDEGDEY